MTKKYYFLFKLLRVNISFLKKEIVFSKMKLNTCEDILHFAAGVEMEICYSALHKPNSAYLNGKRV